MKYLDLFFEENPITELVDGQKEDPTKRLLGNNADEIYAVKDLSKYGSPLWHCLVSVEQYNSLQVEDPKIAKSASKLASKIFKSITKKDGSTDECPIHVFGSQIIDLESKKVYRPDKANIDLTDDEVTIILNQ